MIRCSSLRVQMRYKADSNDPLRSKAEAVMYLNDFEKVHLSADESFCLRRDDCTVPIAGWRDRSKRVPKNGTFGMMTSDLAVDAGVLC